jgi:hypothetical protein
MEILMAKETRTVAEVFTTMSGVMCTPLEPTGINNLVALANFFSFMAQREVPLKNSGFFLDAGKEANAELRRQFPQLIELADSGFAERDPAAALKAAQAILKGETVEVVPLPKGKFISAFERMVVC